MRLTNKDLIEEFFLKERSKYPNLTLEDFREICTSPWRMLRKEMEAGNLTSVRLKYFGIFQVLPGRAKHLLNRNKKNLEKGIINQQQHDKFEKMLKKHLKKYENK